MPLLAVEDLAVAFHTRAGVVRAVNGVSFTLERGESLGIVGESGSGKSVSCLALLGLIPKPPARIERGHAHFNGLDLLRCPDADLRRIRGRRIAMIFQDPMTALNPYLRIEDQLIEPLIVHERINRAAARTRALEALRDVGVPDPQSRLRAHPHEFSGGMRQRVMIAMAMITRPDILICDEPTTALDVTVQAQILELIRREQRANGTAVILVSHDLGVVAGFCDRVQVMYAGETVERAPVRPLFYQPLHPYNLALHRSRPNPHVPRGTELPTLPGLPPDPSRLPPGCAFAPRCEFAIDSCLHEQPALRSIVPDHDSACLRVQRREIQLPESQPAR
ncbi:MAG: ABC transporter ATP-binding protein [Verrucomicrobiae bacterium]|nr:ABC transporter ATP-binding protein [Verrucomicrobiae bacterium]